MVWYSTIQDASLKPQKYYSLATYTALKTSAQTPQKVQAITDIKTPQDLQELQSFHGLVTYLAAFIPNLKDHNAP